MTASAGTRRFPAIRAIGRSGPRVQDQPAVPPEGHHDVRGRVRADPREREQPLLDLVVGEVVAAGRSPSSSRSTSPLAVSSASLHEVRSAVAAAHDVAEEALVLGGEGGGRREGVRQRISLVTHGRVAQMGDERVHHGGGQRPGAVRGADGLHDVLPDGGAPEHPSGPRRDPRELRVVGCSRVERREVLVQAEDVGRGVAERLSGAWRRRGPAHDRDGGAAGPPLSDTDAARPASPHPDRHVERPRRFVHPQGSEVHEAVRDERSPEVHRLPSGASEHELDRLAHRAPTRSARTMRAGYPRARSSEHPVRR